MAKLSLVPQSVDLALYAGDGAVLRLTVTDTATPPAPLPLTGTVEAQIRHERPDAAASADFAVTLDVDAGVATLKLTGEQTAALVNGTGEAFAGAWDVQWSPTGGEPVTLVQGKVTCEPDVTRS